MISIHLLGPRLSDWRVTESWSGESVIKEWSEHLNATDTHFQCMFEQGLYGVEAVMVPEVLVSEHRRSTVTLLCSIPADVQQNILASKHDDEFILKLSDDSLAIRLRYDVESRSTIPLTQSELSRESSKNLQVKRRLTACVARVTIFSP